MKTTCLKWAAALLLSSSAASAFACASQPYLSQVCYTAANYCPQNYLPADGRALQISQYEALYAMIGTQYGGDARTVFNLPDLRSRSVVGSATSNPVGPNPIPMGAMRGQEAVTLTSSQVPPMTLSVNVGTAKATQSTPQDQSQLAAAALPGAGAVPMIYLKPTDPVGTLASLGGLTVQGGVTNPTAVVTLPPQLGLQACVAVQGVFFPRP